MKLRWTPTTIIGLIVVIVFIILALASTKCSAQVYKADSITVAVQYSAQVDEFMTKMNGPKWPAEIRSQWRELYKNRVNEGREAWKRGMTNMFDFDGASGLTKADQSVLLQLKAKQDAYKAEQQRLADSAAAAIKPVGELVGTKPVIFANIGKALSPRMAFLQDVGKSAPAAAPPSGLPFNEDAVITYIYVVHILAVVGVIALGVWTYNAATR